MMGRVAIIGGLRAPLSPERQEAANELLDKLSGPGKSPGVAALIYQAANLTMDETRQLAEGLSVASAYRERFASEIEAEAERRDQRERQIRAGMMGAAYQHAPGCPVGEFPPSPTEAAMAAKASAESASDAALAVRQLADARGNLPAALQIEVDATIRRLLAGVVPAAPVPPDAKA